MGDDFMPVSGSNTGKRSRRSQVENAVRPAGTYARNILNRLLIDLSWNSSRLEGNTYSLLETKRLIELGENAQGKDAAEAQMILNHKGAIEYIIESEGLPQTDATQLFQVIETEILLASRLDRVSFRNGRVFNESTAVLHIRRHRKSGTESLEMGVAVSLFLECLGLRPF